MELGDKTAKSVTNVGNKLSKVFGSFTKKKLNNRTSNDFGESPGSKQVNSSALSKTNLSNNSGSSGFIKEKSKIYKKGYTELNNLYAVQEIQCGTDAIWVIKFRKDGMYVAIGGNDGILRIYKTVDGSTKSKNYQVYYQFYRSTIDSFLRSLP